MYLSNSFIRMDGSIDQSINQFIALISIKSNIYIMFWTQFYVSKQQWQWHIYALPHAVQFQLESPIPQMHNSRLWICFRLLPCLQTMECNRRTQEIQLQEKRSQLPRIHIHIGLRDKMSSHEKFSTKGRKKKMKNKIEYTLKVWRRYQTMFISFRNQP